VQDLSLAFEPRSSKTMIRRPRPANEPLLDRSLLLRILVISLFNWVLIFGVFEWINLTTDNIALARTMAIQALVVGRIFYLLSISQLGLALISLIRGNAAKAINTPAITIGIVGTIILQLLFSQWSLMNNLFSTTPLNLNQWLICLLVGLPMIPVAALVNRFDPLD
jgi:cation-transporting P-type ATPase F